MRIWSYIASKISTPSFKVSIINLDAKLKGFKIITTALKNTETLKEKTLMPQDLPLHSKDNVLVIFGSEAKGLIGNVFSLAHYNVLIPPLLDSETPNKLPYSLVDSLNVSVVLESF